MFGPLARALTAVLILAFVAIVAVGKAGMKEHVLASELTTDATPVSLFGALMSRDALAKIAEIHNDNLVSVVWSKPPERLAQVTERYAKGTQTYWVVGWEPPHRIEESYLLEGPMADAFAALRQRWTTEVDPSGKTRFRRELILTPSNLFAAFELQLRRWVEARREEQQAQAALAALAEWALAHPATSTTAVTASVTLEALR